MSNNKKIAKMFREIADILEYEQVKWKPRAYRRAAATLETLSVNVSEIYEKEGLKGLDALPGVGKDLAAKIKEFLETGKMKDYEELKKKYPIDFDSLTAVPGLGPKKVIKLYKFLGVKTLEDLKLAVKQHRIKRLPGFGEKSELEIAKGLEMIEKMKGRMLLGNSLPLAEKIADYIRNVEGVKRVEIVGSVRRMKETNGDIDILTIARYPRLVMDRFVKAPWVAEVEVKGPAKTTVFLDEGIECDLRVFKEEEFGAAMLYFTGSKAHNIKLRKIAIEKGYKLNEYGLYDRMGRRVASRTEEEIYEHLGLKQWIPPEIREDEGEIEAAIEGTLPKLVGYDEIKGDLQIHTTWSDGTGSVEDMVRAAERMGYEYIVITDHSRMGLAVAKGLEKRKDFEKQREEIESIDTKMDVYAGVEANILPNGHLDVSDDILSELDFVCAGVHSRFRMSKTGMTNRLIRAIKNDYVDVIVHPTGRLIGEREPYLFDYDKVFEEAAERGVLFEVNAFPTRLDLPPHLVRLSKKYGVKLSVGTDSHSTDHLRYMRFGIGTARRGWATAEDIANTMNGREFRNWLKKRKNRKH
ncbi:DNA polymerase/3'-5' exonuclease PolX [Candidatus Micrarchaeota archaeon]|nr:DNA polymerase/3'-5' exonuclease PolX [Candidatus Micrarchaeota archaeon]